MTNVDLVLAQLALLHLGALHPVERALTLVLAFGPFVVLGVVVWWRSRQAQPDEPEVPAQRDR
jgi:hypothetical protein